MWRFLVLLAVIITVIFLAAYGQLVPVIEAIFNGLSSCAASAPQLPAPSNK